jgi:hypothetical protein
MRRTSIAFTVVLLMAFSALGQSSPLVGNWKLNVEKSKYDPGPPPKSSTLRWESVAGGFKFTTDTVNQKGETAHTETMEKTDGSEVTVQRSDKRTNQTRGLKRIDDHNYEDFDKVDGKPTVSRRLVISPDGKTLTVTGSGTNEQGQAVKVVAVYEKQ